MALSLKTKEHILRAAALLVPKWGALLGGGAALALSIGFTGSALHFTTVTDTHGGRVRILTAATDLATVLRQAETPPLGENDKAICPRRMTAPGLTSCAPTPCRSRRTAPRRRSLRPAQRRQSCWRRPG